MSTRCGYRARSGACNAASGMNEKWLTGVGPDDVDAQHAVGAGVRQDLDHALRVLHGAGAAVGLEGEHALVVLDARGLQKKRGKKGER